MPVGPEPEEIEVSVFGRGIGECIVAHCGKGRWIIIDSVQDRDGHVVAERYLDSIGVPSSAVECIVLTHWHEDHVKGAARLVERYSNALVCLPVTLMEDEFLGFLSTYGSVQAGEFGSGVTELIGVFKSIRLAPARVRYASANLTLIESGGVRVDALSPSPHDITLFLTEIREWAALAPGVDRQISNPPRNDASIAIYVAIGESDRILLGGDLEVSGKLSGWQFLRDSIWGERAPAGLFKIPHHGSENAHYEPVWTDLLTDQRMAVLAPYGRGRKLPRDTDVERILGVCDDSYSASALNLPKGSRQANAVERTLEEASIKRRRALAEAGQARFRKKIGTEEWKIELINSACHLSDLLAA